MHFALGEIEPLTRENAQQLQKFAAEATEASPSPPRSHVGYWDAPYPKKLLMTKMEVTWAKVDLMNAIKEALDPWLHKMIYCNDVEGFGAEICLRVISTETETYATVTHVNDRIKK